MHCLTCDLDAEPIIAAWAEDVDTDQYGNVSFTLTVVLACSTCELDRYQAEAAVTLPVGDPLHVCQAPWQVEVGGEPSSSAEEYGALVEVTAACPVCGGGWSESRLVLVPLEAFSPL